MLQLKAVLEPGASPSIDVDAQRRRQLRVLGTKAAEPLLEAQQHSGQLGAAACEHKGK